MSKGNNRRKSILLAFIACCLSALGAEIALRAVGYGQPTKPNISLLEKIEIDGVNYLQPKYAHLANPEIGEIIPLPAGGEFIVLDNMHPFQVPTPRPPDRLRIVVLGSSPAYGTRDTPPLAEALRRQVAEQYPARTVEVADLSNRKVNLEMMWLLAPDVLALEPQAVVISLSGAWPELDAPRVRTAPPWHERFRQTLRQSVLLRLLMDWLTPATVRADEPIRTYLPKPREYVGEYDEREVNVSLNLLEEMQRTRRQGIIRLAETFRDAGIPTVFVGAISDVTSFRPLISRHIRHLAPQKLQEFVDAYSQACTLADRGECALALMHFEQARAIDARFANLYFRRALCRSQLGDIKAAAEDFFNAQRFDLSPERAALAPAQDPVAEILAAGGRYVQPMDILRRESDNPLPPPDWFYDLTHLSPVGQRFVARVAAEELSFIFDNN